MTNLPLIKTLETWLVQNDRLSGMDPKNALYPVVLILSLDDAFTVLSLIKFPELLSRFVGNWNPWVKQSASLKRLLIPSSTQRQILQECLIPILSIAQSFSRTIKAMILGLWVIILREITIEMMLKAFELISLVQVDISKTQDNLFLLYWILSPRMSSSNFYHQRYLPSDQSPQTALGYRSWSWLMNSHLEPCHAGTIFLATKIILRKSVISMVMLWQRVCIQKSICRCAISDL